MHPIFGFWNHKKEQKIYISERGQEVTAVLET